MKANHKDRSPSKMRYPRCKPFPLRQTQWNLSIEDTGTLILVLITEVLSIRRSLNTLHYYTGTQNGVLIIEVSAIQRFVMEGPTVFLNFIYIQCWGVT